MLSELITVLVSILVEHLVSRLELLPRASVAIVPPVAPLVANAPPANAADDLPDVDDPGGRGTVPKPKREDLLPTVGPATHFGCGYRILAISVVLVAGHAATQLLCAAAKRERAWAPASRNDLGVSPCDHVPV